MAGSTGANSGAKHNVLGVERQKTKPQQLQKSKDDIRLSKRMSKALRHHPPACIDSSGWVPLNDLVAHIGMAKSAEQVLRVVETDEKGRFEVDMDHAPARIRATQGHSISLEAPILQTVTEASAVPVAVHLTRPETWQLIQEDGFLRKMGRTHIHFATKPSLARTNRWASCFLKLDVERALEDGVPLQLSSNGVLLVEGPLPVKYVAQVAQFPEVCPPS